MIKIRVSPTRIISSTRLSSVHSQRSVRVSMRARSGYIFVLHQCLLLLSNKWHNSEKWRIRILLFFILFLLGFLSFFFDNVIIYVISISEVADLNNLNETSYNEIRKYTFPSNVSRAILLFSYVKVIDYNCDLWNSSFVWDLQKTNSPF